MTKHIVLQLGSMTMLTDFREFYVQGLTNPVQCLPPLYGFEHRSWSCSCFDSDILRCSKQGALQHLHKLILPINETLSF